MAKIVHVEVEKVRTEGLQARAAINQEVVREYAEAATTGGATLPPIVVFRDELKNLWIGDGIHRLAAAKSVGQKMIPADLRDGMRADALRFALGANGLHGMRRTAVDKAHAVKMAYEHRAELGLPDVPAANMIAGIVGVSNHFVDAQLGTVPSWRDATARTGADGKTREVPPVPTRRAAPKAVVEAAGPAVRQAHGEAPAPYRKATGVEAAGPADPPYPTVNGCGDTDTTELPPVPVRRAAAAEDGGAAALALPPPPTRQKGVETDGPVDCRGRHIPVDLLSIWNRRQECQELATAISRVRVALSKANEGRDPLWWELNYQAVKAQLDQAYFSVSSAQPWCVCPMCQGIGCRACSNRGLMSEYRYDQVVPREFKDAPPARRD